jgi:1-acyl-sn-glycerol-3-phosphate acyltransferase
MVHVAARPNAFGTGCLCAVWRRLGVFPADGWGLRYALELLADGGIVAVFPQARISADLRQASGAVGLLAIRSGAPVVPIALAGTELIRLRPPFTPRAPVLVRIGAPLTFAPGCTDRSRSRAVAEEILAHIGALLEVPPAAPLAANRRRE